ncbi:MAG TPA: PLP-dependent aminotransferase family protein [Candidatus Sulfotelmatobacter sp.]|nr:PLP-dependent aminotransferase family protein [Candidatus Sulfotelmatobacter sp.]
MIHVDRSLTEPLHRQIYNAFRSAIVDGRLRPGQRVPSTRILATEIAVSRFPVLNAYAQLLAEGYLEARVGAGTVVSDSLPEQLTTSAPAGAKKPSPRRGTRHVSLRCSQLPRREFLPWFAHLGAFRVGQVAMDQFPLQIWSALVARHSRSLNIKSAHYGDLMGHESLRRAIANYLKTSRSVRCEPDQVLIVNGSQQALEITTRVLLNPGDRVWVENPSYHLAREVFTLNGCDLVPVPVDIEGLNVPAGIQRCGKARAAFVTPSHQFPLGVTLSASRRLQLIDWAQHAGAWIIEDDYDSEYRYESLPIASLQGLDPNSRVIYIGTFSKVLFPSLRLGYIVVPPDLIDRFVIMRRTMDLGPPTLYQQVLADFIEEGHFARHLRRMRVYYGGLRRVLFDNVTRLLGDSAEIAGDEAGMHLTLLLRTRHRDRELAHQALAHNLSLWPLSPSYVTGTRQGLILGFGATTTKEICDGVRALGIMLSGKRAGT